MFNRLYGKRILKRVDIWVCTTDSLCCILETDTTLAIKDTLRKNFEKREKLEKWRGKTDRRNSAHNPTSGHFKPIFQMISLHVVREGFADGRIKISCFFNDV